MPHHVHQAHDEERAAHYYQAQTIQPQNEHQFHFHFQAPSAYPVPDQQAGHSAHHAHAHAHHLPSAFPVPHQIERHAQGQVTSHSVPLSSTAYEASAAPPGASSQSDNRRQIFTTQMEPWFELINYYNIPGSLRATMKSSPHKAPTSQSITRFRTSKTGTTLLNLPDWCPDYTGPAPVIDPRIPVTILNKLIEPNYIYDEILHWRLIKSVHVYSGGTTEGKDGVLAIWRLYIDVAGENTDDRLTYHFFVCNDPAVPDCQWAFRTSESCKRHQGSGNHGPNHGRKDLVFLPQNPPTY